MPRLTASMLFVRLPPPRPVLTPCIGVCELRADGLCAGCFRTTDEIAGWGSYDDGTRLRLMDEVLPKRAAEHP